LFQEQYKKVAVVENFFDIIYSVHVDMEGRAGKHAGQKRTYRAVSIKYLKTSRGSGVGGGERMSNKGQTTC
jgi:hypothetical protein